MDENNEDHWIITSSIDNDLEHLIIVPREAIHGFNPFSYWAKTHRILWRRYPWPEVNEPFARRKNLLTGSVAAFNLTKDAEVISLVRECLSKEGMLKEALLFNKRITDVLHSKEKMLRLTVEHLGIPKSDVRLLYIDIRGQQVRYSAL